MSMCITPWVSLFFCLTLTACAMGPDYIRPEVPLLEHWSTTVTSDEINAMVQPHWWTAFGDPELDTLLQTAVLQNLDMKIATANLEQSRAIAQIEAAPLLGTAALSLRYEKTKQSRRIAEEPSVALRELGVTAPPNPSKQYSLPLEVFYEFDLWGRLRRAREAATAEFHATREDAHAIYLSLLVAVAGNYFDIRELDERIVVTERAHLLSRTTLRIAEKRYAAGMIGQADVLRERAHGAQLDSDLIELKRRRAERQYALAVLLGKPPGTLEVPVKTLRTTVQIPQIAPGLPSSLLARRPDVRAAEYRLIAANARIGEAKAAFFPTFSLTGSYGYQSRELDGLLSPKSSTWGISPQLYLPLFDGGKRQGQLQAAHAGTEEAVERYRLTLLRAFQEVETALSDGFHHSQQQTQIAMAVEMLNTAHALVRRQYEYGQVALLDVLDAERSLLAVEERALVLHRARLDAVLLLYKALGGGWEQSVLVDQQ